MGGIRKKDSVSGRSTESAAFIGAFYVLHKNPNHCADIIPDQHHYSRRIENQFKLQRYPGYPGTHRRGESRSRVHQN
jgi:hypothetical protein